jgi:hypothetical protein
MSDNIGGFKINGTVFAGARMASTDGGAPTAVAGSYNRDFNSQFREVLTIIVVFRVRKVFDCHRVTVVQQVFL